MALLLSNPVISGKLVISRHIPGKTGGGVCLKTHFLGLIRKVNKIAYEHIPTVRGTYSDYYHCC